VLLRAWTMDDLGCVEEASGDPDIPTGTTVPAAYTPAEGAAWIERQWGRAETGEGISLAITDAPSDEALGAAVLLAKPQRGSASLGYWMIPRARRRGLATRAVGLLVRWAVGDGGLHRVEAVVEVGNVASQRVLETNGFQREGQLRSYLSFRKGRADALMYSLLPRDLGYE
ncbi:MAG TPA: GNAT family N-acetyltransferase, partial [Gaiellales bacterium]